MLQKAVLVFAASVLLLSDVSSSAGVTIEWATIGNPGNGPDHETGYGAVDYAYRISKHEVTNTQYAEFLNAVAATDSNELYNTGMGTSTWGGIIRSGSSGSYTYSVKPDEVGQGPGGADGDDYTYANKPVVYVSFFDAMRFVNWLKNEQPTGAQGSGTTEDGVYMISDGLSEVRNPNATFFLPSLDEWYKAAYYDHSGNGGSGIYFDYPTSTDLVPSNNLPSADTGNSANFRVNVFDTGHTTGNFHYPMTDVGAYGLSASPYGTYDQGGNVFEWSELIISSTFRGFRAGAWYNEADVLTVVVQSGNLPSIENAGVGFRVASIPEPPTYTLALALAAQCLTTGRRRC